MTASQYRSMQLSGKCAALVLLAFALCPLLSAQKTPRSKAPLKVDSGRYHSPATLTPDDGLSVIAAALDAHAYAGRRPDCSHLVHAIYDRAGFSYPYASSSDLYRGTDDFQVVAHPQPGDLVVWSGHVGIVVNPAQSEFFSTLRHGPGIDTYDTKYWQQRGPVRFYRYIKGGSAGDGVRPE